jgi:hypothetical protein
MKLPSAFTDVPKQVWAPSVKSHRFVQIMGLLPWL